MKIRLISILFISVFIFAGCQSKGSSTSSTSGTSPNDKAVVTSNKNSDNSKATIKPVTPVIAPQLNQPQKLQITDNFNTVLDNINSSLNSLDDVKDLDLNSID